MKRKILRLSPLKEYIYPIMNANGIKVTEHVSYGGEDSETLPCGFIQDIVYEKARKRKLDNRLRAVANKLDIPSSTNKKS